MAGRPVAVNPATQKSAARGTHCSIILLYAVGRTALASILMRAVPASGVMATRTGTRGRAIARTKLRTTAKKSLYREIAIKTVQETMQQQRPARSAGGGIRP